MVYPRPPRERIRIDPEPGVFRVTVARTMLAALGLAILALAAWVAAPALSLAPYAPAPVEFHQPLPPLRAEPPSRGAAASTPVRYLSPAIEAPRRFDLVGIGGERRAVEYRYRAAGGRWSDWLAVDSGDPVWAGGADELQLRTAGFRPRGNLDYVNVSGTDSAGHRLLSAVRGTIHGAFVSAASLVDSDSAAAAPSMPHFVPRSSWDPNDRCKPRARPSYGSVKAAVVHHTVMGGNGYSRTEAKRIVLGICLFHRNDNGWNDIGYNALVSRFGQLFAGRAGGMRRAVVGAHTLSYNDVTTGIASIGDHSSKPIGADERHALVHYLAWKLSHHGAVPADGKTTLHGTRVSRVTMHRRLNSTECPGGALAGQLPLIRRQTQARIAAN